MNTILKNLIAVASFATALSSCSQPVPNNLDKFLGVWKKMGKDKNLTYMIRMKNNAVLLISGKDTCAGGYDPNQDVLKFYALDTTVSIRLDPESRRISLNNGKDGEFEKIGY